MAIGLYVKIQKAVAQFFTTRRKWKTLEYTVRVLLVAFLAAIVAFPFKMGEEKSRVGEAARAVLGYSPKTTKDAAMFLPGGQSSSHLSSQDQSVLGYVTAVSLREGEVALPGREEAPLLPEGPNAPGRVRFSTVQGVPAWTESIALADGQLIFYRTLPWAVGYAWCSFFLLVLLTGLALPLVVRKLQLRIQMIPNFLRRQIILYGVASLLPAGLICLALVAGAVASQTLSIHWVPSGGVLVLLTLGLLGLVAWSMFVAARDLNHRINDSLLVLTNGMEMASNLDFDHPIIPIVHDEIGLVAEVFNQVNHVLKTRVYILQALFNNVRIFSGLLHRDQILDHTLKTFVSLAEAGEIVIALLDEEAGDMVVERSLSGRPELAGLRFPKGEGVPGKTQQEPQLLFLTGEEYEPIASQSPKERQLWGKPDFVLSIPLLFKGGFKGAVILYALKTEDFQLETKRDYLLGLTNQIAIFLENTRLYSMVIRDRLTGLFVHSFLEAYLENLLAQAKRYKFPVSFVMLDVDNFKQINDRFGHPLGNRLLKAVGGAIKSASRNADLKGRPATSETPMGISRESDMGGRFGGDEFEIVLPHTDKEGGLVYAERLRKTIEAIEIDAAPGVKVHVTLSIGLATFPQDGGDATQLQASADSALYTAKALGRNQVAAYKAAEPEKA